MRHDLVPHLACPGCANGQLELEASSRQDSEVISGRLSCANCNRTYPIVHGVPRLNEQIEAYELERVAETFSFEWQAYHRGDYEQDTLFGRTRAEDWQMVLKGMRISETDVSGARVLDVGCGSGRFCQLFADHGAEVVVGVDMSEAVDEAADYCKRFPNISIVQANLFALPFKPESFDLVWCNGVIHHTPDPAQAHKSLSLHVRPGGILYVWVYPKRFSPFNLVKRVFDLLRVSRLPSAVLHRLAKAMAYPSLVLLQIYRAVRALPGFGPRTEWGKRTLRPRTVDELELTWFDSISPEFDSTHDESEVVDWFRREGFTDIGVLEEPKIGVRGASPRR